MTNPIRKRADDPAEDDLAAQLQSALGRIWDLETLEATRIVALESTVDGIRYDRPPQEPSVLLPPPFNGTSVELKSFLSRLDAVFELQRKTYHPDRMKIAATSALLHGVAATWYVACV